MHNEEDKNIVGHEIEKERAVEKISEEKKKEFEKIKHKLETFKKQLLKKFQFISAIGLLPPQASKLIEEEEEVPEKETKENPIHVMLIIPEDKSKELGKLKIEAIKLVQNIKPKIWIHVKAIPQIWEICFDGKYEYIDAISMSFPLYDTGILGALRVASVHKTLVLKKFERYVVSYVIAGSIVRGTATKTSDVDVYVVIDDCDVKRMSRFELKEKLRAIIYSYVSDASEIAGVKNKLSPQVYILTEFWEAVKDAHPVIFTFIRDGVPLYDRGAFMPWKLLLKMGKIKPSPEAIDMFMSLGERVNEAVKRKLTEIATEDIYWGVITPSQAVLMLYGIAPPTPRETVELMEKIFVKKEKLLEQRYINILKKIVDIYKNYEHERVKTISGKEIDELLKETSAYMKRLKELMGQIEIRMKEKTVLQLHDEIFKLLEKILGKGSEQKLIERFEKELIKKGKMPPRTLETLKEISKIRKQKKIRLAKHELAVLRKDAFLLTSLLIDYTQRRELLKLNKIKIKYRKDNKIIEAEAFPLESKLIVITPEAVSYTHLTLPTKA